MRNSELVFLLVILILQETQSSEVCKDKMPTSMCKIWKKNGVCVQSASRNRAKEYCADSCGFCDVNYISCVDNHYRCPMWVRAQACRTHPEKMQKLCERSCGFCKAPFPEFIACQQSMYGCCSDMVTKATGPNMQGCGDCSDVYKYLCPRFIDECYNPNTMSFMYQRCSNTCGLCKKGRRSGL